MNLQNWWKAAARFAALLLGVVTLLPVSADAQKPAGETQIEGILSVVWGDPRPGSQGGETRFTITAPDGTAHALNLSSAQQSMALHLFNKRAIVQGWMLRSVSGPAQIAVSQLTPLAQEKPAARAPLVKRVLYVLLRFNGDAQEPHPPGFYSDLTNPFKAPVGSNVVSTINGFFRKTSWGHLQWSADVVGWLTLPKTKAQYAPCGWSSACADLAGIGNDGLALAAAAGADLSVYDNLNFVLNNDLDCCAWGGGFTYNGKSYGATWEPPWAQQAGTYVHELGHSLGLPHSGWRYYAYDSPWDQMSTGTVSKYAQCATYFSANSNVPTGVNCVEPGSGYIAAHKEYLGWLPPANIVVIDAPTTRNVTLEANSLPLGTTAKMIKVCLPAQPCTGAAAHYLTVEARIRASRFEMGLPGEGVIIHDFRADRKAIGAANPCYFNSQSGWAVPVDFTKGDWQGNPACNSGGLAWPNYALGNAQYPVGSVYRSAKQNIRIKVQERIGNSFVLRITRAVTTAGGPAP